MKRRNKCIAYKKAYSTTDDCIRVIRKVFKHKKVKLRYYECPICLDFHLTRSNANIQFNKLYTEWKTENKLRDSRQRIAKQYRQFEELFNRMNHKLYGTKKKPKTILKGILPREDRLRALAELKARREAIKPEFATLKKLWINTLQLFKNDKIEV